MSYYPLQSSGNSNAGLFVPYKERTEKYEMSQ